MAGIGPQLPPHLHASAGTEDGDGRSMSVGPQLPPHLLALAGTKDGDGGDMHVGPQLPGHLPKEDEVKEIKSFGPALPPGYSNSCDEKEQRQTSTAIGPTLPNNFSTDEDSNDDSDTDIIGPTLPFEHSSKQSESYEHIKTQFEARAKAMKNKLTGTNLEDTNIQRESWMLELPPEVGKNFGLGPRTFRTKAVDLGDRSVWTDTPADRERKRAADRERKRTEDSEDQPAKKKKLPTEEELAMRTRVEEYNKKTRPQSLLEMHRETHKKEETGVRRPFDRDKDLALHRTDPKSKAKFIEDAKQMNKKFSSGNYENKFL